MNQQPWQQLVTTFGTSAPFYMNKGQQYSVRLNYFQLEGDSLLELAWSTVGIPEQITPKSQFSCLRA